MPRQTLFQPGVHLKLVVLLFSLFIATRVMANPPDLTAGGVPGDTVSFNMGPTGARGWAYHVREDTSASRQIQIKSVAAGSPAAGILAANDVILGANGTGADPVEFTYDARKALADAINDAEARNPATLKLLRWQAGTTSIVTLTLQTMGSYSATAPYNCPKSSLILQRGLQAIMAGETSGRYSFGTLSLLAANNPADPDNAARLSRAQTEARALIPNATLMATLLSDQRDATSMVTWQRGHTLVVLAEYYLLTGDAQVLPAIEAYAVNISRNSSLFGTMGHIFANKNPDGSDNGPMGGVYGPVNSSGMTCFLGLLLARECGVTHWSLDPAIERMSRFYAYYTGRGAVPYGEHEAYWQRHESNGKSGLAALCFHLLANRAEEAKFNAKLATAAATERELGHTGAFFNYLWSPLGAAAGGEEAASAHFRGIRWMLDLSRRWDGKFEYDCLNGEGPNSGSTYNDYRMSTAVLLTYALPLRQLRVTGKNHDSSRYLTSTDIAEATAADGYIATTRTIPQLIADLGNWSPMVQRRAAEQLATRSIDTATLNQIIALANDPNGSSRIGACFTLGKISNTSTANTRAAALGALLTDPDNHVRFIAAESLRYLPDSARLTQLNAILSAAASTAKPLIPFDEEDPLHFAHGRLAMLLFYSGSAYGPKGVIWGSKINSPTVIDRNLLYPAIRAVAANPVGQARSCLTETYRNLTAADVNALASTMVESVRFGAPSDKMFNGGIRMGGLDALEKYDNAEGVPLSMIYMVDDTRGDAYTHGLNVLKRYAGGSTTVTPDPKVVEFCQSQLGTARATLALEVLNAIAADTNPVPLTPFKSIQSVTVDAPSLNLPLNQTTLRATAGDLAQGDLVYTWRKIHGAGNVTFTPNGTADAKTTSIQYDNTPGTYLFEVTVSDSRGLTEVYGTVTTTLRNPDGTLPTNHPPTANPQSLTANPSSVKSIQLTGTDPEGYPLIYSIVSRPANGKLAGTAPNLEYTANPGFLGNDSFVFQVMDTEGQTSSATVTINVSAAGVELYAYEGFDYAPGLLAGKQGGTGLSGSWADGPETPGKAYTYDQTTATTPIVYANAGGPLSWDGVVDNLPTSPATGARFVGLSATEVDRWEAHRPLASSAGAMAAENNNVLWVSAVAHYKGGGYGAHFGLALATNSFTNRSGNLSTSATFGGSTAGNGLGVGGAFNNDYITPVVFNGGNIAARTTANANLLSTTADNIVILKFVFGETDTVHACRFVETEAFDEATFNARAISASGVVDENTLNQLTFSCVRGAHAIDEIRIGNSFAAVIGVEGPPPDTDSPTLLAIADDRGGETATQGDAITYTLTFSEPMNPASIEAADFGNAGTAAITLESITQPLPDVVLVQVRPTTTGTLQFRIQQNATLTDVAGNSLDTTTALADDTIITINSSMAEVPYVLGLTQSAAQQAITDAGFVTGTITTQYSATIPAGQVIAQDPNGGFMLAYGSPVNLTVSLGPLSDKIYATASLPVTGTVTNTHTATHASDNVRQSIREIESKGNPQQRYSYLEHKWRFEAPTPADLTFAVEAHHTSNTESDNFTFAYSTAGENGPWTNMVTVNKTADNDTVQTFTLPPGLSGFIHVRVIDTNRTGGRRVLDTVFIDHMYLQAEWMRETPTIESWPTATAIVEGQTLSAARLEGGSASVPGIFTFQDPAQMPARGSQSAAVIFTPDDTSAHENVAGSVIVPVQTVFEAWAAQGGVNASFAGDSNQDGVPDGMAWLLGAPSPAHHAAAMLPKPQRENGVFSLQFETLAPAQRGAATLRLQRSSTLAPDSWTFVDIPATSGVVDGISFTISAIPESNRVDVRAEMPVNPGSGEFIRLISTVP